MDGKNLFVREPAQVYGNYGISNFLGYVFNILLYKCDKNEDVLSNLFLGFVGAVVVGILILGV